MINKVQSITNCYWFGAEEVYYYLFKVFISLVFVSTKDMSVNYSLDDGQWPVSPVTGAVWAVLAGAGDEWAAVGGGAWPGPGPRCPGHGLHWPWPCPSHQPSSNVTLSSLHLQCGILP